jgi:hypothetical protein
MKRLLINMTYRFLFVFVSSFLMVVAAAQDSTGSVKTTTTKTTTTTTTDWYMQPWVWAVGGAVFLIILIALLRGNSSKDTSVSNTRTTVIKDRDY